MSREDFYKFYAGTGVSRAWRDKEMAATRCKAAELVVNRLVEGGWKKVGRGKHEKWQHPNGAIHSVPGTVSEKGRRGLNSITDIERKEKNPKFGLLQSHKSQPKEPEVANLMPPAAPTKKHVVSLDTVVEVEHGFPIPSPSLPWFQWITKVLAFNGRTPKDLPEVMLPYRWSNQSAKQMCRGEKFSKGDGGKVRMTEEELSHFLSVLMVPMEYRRVVGYVPLVPTTNPQARLRLPLDIVEPVAAPAPVVVDTPAPVVVAPTPVVVEPVAPVVAAPPAPQGLSKAQAQAEELAWATRFLEEMDATTPDHLVLKAKRITMGLSQTQVGKLIGRGDMVQPYISIYERGERNCPESNKVLWIKALFGNELPKAWDVFMEAGVYGTLVKKAEPTPEECIIEEEPGMEWNTVTVDLGSGPSDGPVDLASLIPAATPAPIEVVAVALTTPTREGIIAEATRIFTLSRISDEEAAALLAFLKQEAFRIASNL